MVLCKFLWRVLGVLLWTTGIYAQSNGKQTPKAVKYLDKEIMAKVERSLLSTFGLKEKPNVDASRVDVPPYMLYLYNLHMAKNRQEANEEHSNTISELDPNLLASIVRSYPHEDTIDDSLDSARTMILQFNVSAIPDKEIIRAVELRICHDAHLSSAIPPPFVRQQHKSVKLTKKDLKYLQRLRIYDILRPSVDENGPVHRLLDTTVVDSRRSGTVKFDVASAVKRWLQRAKRNYGLYLEVVPLKAGAPAHRQHLHIRLKRHVPPVVSHYSSTSTEDRQHPLLVIHSDDGAAKPRAKRDAKPAYKRYVHHCQRHPLRVDFRKVEWTNWIVAPAGYDAFFCQGECHFPLAEHMNATNHAVVQTLVHSRYPSRVPSACCIPTEHTAISMLYVDEDERVVLKNYQDMVVEACGCR